MRLAIGLLLALCGVAFTRAATEKPTTHQGNVVSLTEQLKKDGTEPDLEVGLLLALQTEQGKTLPLLRDGGSRMFFTDPRLLNRPMRLLVRPVAKGTLWQVLEIHSLKDGKLHDVHYWCEICAIKRGNLDPRGHCDCCGGPMELRETPLGK